MTKLTIYPDFCGWSNVPPITNKKQVLWTRNSGETDSDDSGPERDHTTNSDQGWYVYVPLDAQSDGVAVLRSEPLGPLTTACFGFYYHIYDDWDVAPKLSVLYQPNTGAQATVLGTLHSSDLDQWRLFNVTVNNLPAGRFQLQTFLGQSSAADVAVDDISIRPGACSNLRPTTTTPLPVTAEPQSAKQWDCTWESPCNWMVGNGWSKSSWTMSKS